jgi:hypothetical protein
MMNRFVFVLAFASILYFHGVPVSGQTSGQIAASRARKGIEALADWAAMDGSSDFSNPFPDNSPGRGPASHFPQRICGVITNPSAYTITRMDWAASAQLGNRSANQAAEQLQRRVLQFLRKSGWRSVADSCYQRDRAMIQVLKSYGRCTMNSKCVGADALSVYVFSPNSSTAENQPLKQHPERVNHRC